MFRILALNGSCGYSNPLHCERLNSVACTCVYSAPFPGRAELFDDPTEGGVWAQNGRETLTVVQVSVLET